MAIGQKKALKFGEIDLFAIWKLTALLGNSRESGELPLCVAAQLSCICLQTQARPIFYLFTYLSKVEKP